MAHHEATLVSKRTISHGNLSPAFQQFSRRFRSYLLRALPTELKDKANKYRPVKTCTAMSVLQTQASLLDTELSLVEMPFQLVSPLQIH